MTQTLPCEYTERNASDLPGENSQESDFATGVLEQMESLYRAALRITRNPQEAEDLLQDVLLKAFRFASTFQPGSSIRSWLFQILKNTAINNYRKKTHQPFLLSLEAEERPHEIADTDVFSDPEALLLHGQIEGEIAEALAAVPSGHRSALILACIDDYSYKEIAEHLQIPIGTVMSRISRGKTMLRTLLADHAQKHGYTLKDTDTHSDQ